MQTDKQDPSLSLEGFVDKLLTEKGIVSVDAETRGQMKRDLVTRLEDRINAVIIENMPADKMEEFERLLDNADKEEINDFCRASIPELDELMAAELISFRTNYLANN